MTSMARHKRQLVHRAGKWFLRWTGDFQGRHSRVGTTPVLDNAEFPWISQLESNWRVIRSELEPLLAHPERIPVEEGH